MCVLVWTGAELSGGDEAGQESDDAFVTLPPETFSNKENLKKYEICVVGGFLLFGFYGIFLSSHVRWTDGTPPSG